MKVEGIRELMPIEPLRPVIKDLTGDAAGEMVKALDNREEGQKEKVDLQALKKAVDLVNTTMENYNTELKFTLHKGSGEYIIQVINTKDNSTIREIPPKRVLDMVAHFKEVLGLVVDKFI